MDHRLHRLVEVPVPAATIPVVVTANTPDRHRPGGVPARLRHVGQLLVLLWWLDQPQPDEALLERPGHAPSPTFVRVVILRRPPRLAHSRPPPVRGRDLAPPRRAPV